VEGPVNSLAVTVALVGVGVYFSVAIVLRLVAYLRFRRERGEALATWPARRPPILPLLTLLGGVALALAAWGVAAGRPAVHVWSQASTALYFLALVPLTFRIPRGLYQNGVWADRGFLRYDEVGRLAFLEEPEIVLVLLRRGTRAGAYRLQVPPAEYGGVRKLLSERARAGVLQLDPAVLGL